MSASRTDRRARLQDARLYLLIVGHVVRLNEETPGSLAHLEVEVLDGPRRAAIQRRRDAYERAFREVLEEGRAAGVFRAADAKVAALAVLGAINWTVKWFRPEGGKSAREIGAEHAELLVRGLLAPGAALEVPDLDLLTETRAPSSEDRTPEENG